jgi:hypothetical protein
MILDRRAAILPRADFHPVFSFQSDFERSGNRFA